MTEENDLQEFLSEIRALTTKIIPVGESKPFDRRYKKRLRKQLQRRGYNYSTVRNHGYTVYPIAIKDKAIDIAFPVVNGMVSIQVNLVERDQSITIPRHEPKEGIPLHLLDQTDKEYMVALSTAMATEAPYLKDNGYTWMMWSIPILRSQAYTIDAAKAAILKRAEELEIPCTYHTTYPDPYESNINTRICMVGLGPMEDLEEEEE
jgi:hypothetical protein